MRNYASSSRAFTLVELIFSIALGLLICYAAFATFRLTSGTVNRAKQMSLENRLLRVGILRALEAADTWAMYDDPWRATAQPLRTTTDSNPFRPLPNTVNLDLTSTAPGNWWRGQPVGNNVSSTAYGCYPLFSGLARLGARSTYAKRMQGLMDTLGHQALLDYAPLNSVFMYFDASDAIPAAMQATNFLNDPTQKILYGFNDLGRDIARGFRQLTWARSFLITTDKGLLANGVNHKYFYATYQAYLGAANNQDPAFDLNEATQILVAEQESLTTPKPAAWPDLNLSVFNNNILTVTLRNPVDGTVSTMHFAVGVTTTLRGARQQRGLDNAALATTGAWQPQLPWSAL